MAYCTATNIRDFSGLTQAEISDSDLATLISYATIQLNSMINTKINRESVEWIDETRENSIDGLNTIYYIKSWQFYYLGDLDNDGDVDTSDVIVYLVDLTGIESLATVSAIDHDDGKITLSSAPASGNDISITYTAAPVDESTPDNLIKLACSQLTAALAFTKIDAKKLVNFSIGKVKISKQSQAFDIFYNQYLRTINLIKKYPLKKQKAETLVKRR